jgi:large subunit ribosomal protein L21
MYAIVRIGGRQYIAEPGKSVFVEKLTHEVGETVHFEEVLLISDGENTQVGRPLVGGAGVTAEVTEQFKGEKIVVFKYKPKIKYRRKSGHRQKYTRLTITSIDGMGVSTPVKKAKARTRKASARKPEVEADEVGN